jgi:hypothetical protein
VRRVLNQTLISTVVLAIVVVGLALIDERVQRGLMDLLHGTPTGELARASDGAMAFGSVVLSAAATQGAANAPLMLFVVVATVLMLFMVRT